MDISLYVIKVGVLAIPGLVGSKIYRKLRGNTTKQPWEDFLEILLFSVLSYAGCAMIHAVCSGSTLLLRYVKYWTKIAPSPPHTDGFHLIEWINTSASQAFTPFVDQNASFKWSEILLATVCGICLSGFASYVNKNKWVNNLGQKRWIIPKLFAGKRIGFGQFSSLIPKQVQLSDHYGDEDVWEFFHNSEYSGDWVFVRDHKLDLVYFGHIRVFSDSGKDRELVLTEVSVYNNKNPTTALYAVKILYICRAKQDISIEVPDTDLNLPDPALSSPDNGETYE